LNKFYVYVCTKILLIVPLEKSENIQVLYECFRTVLILTWKMHWCISQRGWPCHDWPGRTSASRTARAPQCTAAVESLCRYLSFARDRRPTLSVDCRRCWLPVHLHLDAISALVLSPPNLLYHIGCDIIFGLYGDTMMGLLFHPVVSRFLAICAH